MAAMRSPSRGGCTFVIGSDSVPPEVNEALQGAKVGDERTAAKILPDDLDDGQGRQDGRYTIKRQVAEA